MYVFDMDTMGVTTVDSKKDVFVVDLPVEEKEKEKEEEEEEEETKNEKGDFFDRMYRFSRCNILGLLVCHLMMLIGAMILILCSLFVDDTDRAGLGYWLTVVGQTLLILGTLTSSFILGVLDREELLAKEELELKKKLLAKKCSCGKCSCV